MSVKSRDGLAASKELDMMAAAAARVLVVQGPLEVGLSFASMFSNWGFVVREARSLQDGYDALANFRPELTVIALPPTGDESFSFLAAVVDAGSRCVIVAPAGDLAMRIRALDAGADDWINAPASSEELRIKARHLLARQSAQLSGREDLIVELEGIRIDVLSRALIKSDGGPGPALTDTEFALLRILTRNANQLVTKDALMKGLKGRSASGLRTLDVTISRLRAKLKSADVKAEVRSVRQLGYFYSQHSARIAS